MTKKYNLIIVDDEEMSRDCATAVMGDLGHNILCECKNGFEATEAFRIFQNVNPIMILDMDMPLQNGYDAFQTMQKIAPFNDIIIFASKRCDSTANNIQHMIDAGCFYLEKSSDYELMTPLFEQINNRSEREPLTANEINSEWLSLKNELEDLTAQIKQTTTALMEFAHDTIKKRLAQIEKHKGTTVNDSFNQYN